MSTLRNKIVRASAAAFSAAALATGCASSGEDGGGPGRLVVREVPLAAPRYIEGSATFLRLEREDTARLVFEGQVTDRPHGGIHGIIRVFDRRLPAGLHSLQAYQRSCQAAVCAALLGPPADRCDAEIDIRPGRTTNATLILRQSGGCTILLDPPPARPAAPAIACAAWRLDAGRLEARLALLYRAQRRSARAEQPRIQRAVMRAASRLQQRAGLVSARCQ